MVRLQGTDPRKRGGCATALIWIGIIIVAGLLLSFVVHLIVAIVVVCIAIGIVAALWAIIRRWL